MKIQLTEEEIQLTVVKGKFTYHLVDMKVEGFATKIEAIEHAERFFKKFLTKKYFKK